MWLPIYSVVILSQLVAISHQAKQNLGTIQKRADSLSYDELHNLLVERQWLSGSAQDKLSIDQKMAAGLMEKPILPIKSLGSRPRLKSLNGMFEFCFDPSKEGFRQEWFSKRLEFACRAENFYLMPVPSAFNEILTNTTALNYMGWFWYQREFPLYSLALASESELGYKTLLQKTRI